MHLSTVMIRNFRNIEGLVVNLRPHLNVIVGVNNVGKTNFAAALQVALGQQMLSESDIRILPDGNRCEEPIGIDLTFSSLSIEEQAHYVDILNYNPDDPSKSTASIHFEASWPLESRRPS
jgi:predicted ATP-dependent endonuclease of OLD family